jgi:hypothetical protein
MNSAPLCACGCGEAVSRHGLKWKTFRQGHVARVRHPSYNGGVWTCRGRVYIRVHNHPSANSNGYVLRARVVAETAIGRSLAKGEHVHHINGDKSDDRPENLQVLTVQQHHKLHAKDYSARMSGTKNPGAKLTESEVRAIRAMPHTIATRTIAALYQVDSDTIRQIRKHETWSHIS